MDKFRILEPKHAKRRRRGVMHAALLGKRPEQDYYNYYYAPN